MRLAQGKSEIWEGEFSYRKDELEENRRKKYIGWNRNRRFFDRQKRKKNLFAGETNKTDNYKTDDDEDVGNDVDGDDADSDDELELDCCDER